METKFKAFAVMLGEEDMDERLFMSRATAEQAAEEHREFTNEVEILEVTVSFPAPDTAMPLTNVISLKRNI